MVSFSRVVYIFQLIIKSLDHLIFKVSDFLLLFFDI